MSDRTLEEYLESIGILEERDSTVKTAALSETLGVTPASVSEMLKRLSEKGLVDYVPYKGVSLTGEGRKLVLSLSRRHRLWEVFLHKYLGIGWEDVYPEACNLEHVTSPMVTDKLAMFLGDPKLCPHGQPIPDANLELPELTGIPLILADQNRDVSVVGVTNEKDSEYLHYLSEIGITPGTKIKILEKASFDGTLTLDVAGEVKAIGPEAAGFILVEYV